MKDMCTEEIKRCSGLQEYFSHYYLIQANCNEAASQVGYEGHKQRNALHHAHETNDIVFVNDRFVSHACDM